jgi:hypothetical protein
MVPLKRKDYQLSGFPGRLSSYDGHTVTGMSAVPGSTQLTLHLQSPAAAAAAQQAAETAAAAVEADPAAWKEHQVGWPCTASVLALLIVFSRQCCHQALEFAAYFQFIPAEKLFSRSL